MFQTSSAAQLPTMPNQAKTTISAAISILTLRTFVYVFCAFADTHQHFGLQTSSAAQLPTMPNQANTTISATISILTLLSFLFFMLLPILISILVFRLRLQPSCQQCRTKLVQPSVLPFPF